MKTFLIVVVASSAVICAINGIIAPRWEQRVEWFLRAIFLLLIELAALGRSVG